MKLISIFNNQEILEAGLLSSHPEFLKNCDIVLIDNTCNKFISFSQAISQVLSSLPLDEIIIIAHQDVIFYKQDTHLKIEEGINEFIKDSYYLGGFAGVGSFSRIAEESGVNPIICGGKQVNYRLIDIPVPVDTIDECVIVTTRRTIQEFNLFDDERFRWHLYAVDACMKLKIIGYQPYVFPILINHLSLGKLDDEFFDLSKYLLNKYKVKDIYTTNLHITKRYIWLTHFKYFIKNLITDIS